MITHTGIVHRTLFPSLLWRMPGKKVFLTFDDGPHSRVTPVVLDILRNYDVHATFFVSGKNIAGREDIIKRIAYEGHSLGVHAYNHSRKLAFSKKQTKREIEQTEKSLSEIIHLPVRLFRPPYGFFSWNTISAARELGYFLVMWSCLTGDFRSWNNEKIVQVALNRLTHGSILVFHDNDVTEHKVGPLLEMLIPEITRRGFEFGAIR